MLEDEHESEVSQTRFHKGSENTEKRKIIIVAAMSPGATILLIDVIINTRR